MTEKIVKEDKLRKGIQKGINKLADAVKSTLGPLGNTVIIKNAFGEIVITKDGVSVAEELFFDTNSVESLGAELVKNVSIKANNLAGDGTTTATVLSQAIYNSGIKQLALGSKPLEFNKGIRIASIDVLKWIEDNMKKDINLESEDLHSVAMVSSNGEQWIADTIAKIYNELGTNAVISITQGNSMESSVNIVKGMQFDRGYLSPYCVTDKIKMKADYENPLIFLYDGKISEFKQIFKAVEYAGEKARPLIIVAEDVQESALRGLVVNHVQGNVRSAVVLSPGYGKKRVERLRDMGVLFNGEVMDKDTDMEDFDFSWLGEVAKAEITDKETAFIGGNGSQEKIDERVRFIQSQLEFFKGNKYEVDILEERLGKLSSGVAVLKIGALSKEEGKELLDRAEDCKHAVKAALLEGIVDGGGISFLFASSALSSKTFKEDISPSLKAGYQALLDAVRVPFKQILINAGEIPEVIEAELFGHPDNRGYDVKKGVYVKNMKEAGIIDPFKVLRIALESAVSIVGTLLTSNYAVINKDDTTTTNFR